MNWKEYWSDCFFAYFGHQKFDFRLWQGAIEQSIYEEKNRDFFSFGDYAATITHLKCIKTRVYRVSVSLCKEKIDFVFRTLFDTDPSVWLFRFEEHMPEKNGLSVRFILCVTR